MTTQELQAVQELYNLVHQWREKYTVGWVNTSQQMKIFYRGVTYLTKSLQVLTNTEYLPCVTVEEKEACRTFYVLSETVYKINLHINEERWFEVTNTEDPNDTFIVRYDSIPEDALEVPAHGWR